MQNVVGKPAIVSTGLVSVLFKLPDNPEYLALSDEELQGFRETVGQLAHAQASLLSAALVEPRLLKLLARVQRTTADMFEEERKELEAE